MPLCVCVSAYPCLFSDRVKNENSSFVFTYTPMHGVGQRFAENAFEVFGLKPFISVTEQASPDPDFPTVTFPNPEEGKSALVSATGHYSLFRNK